MNRLLIIVGSALIVISAASFLLGCSGIIEGIDSAMPASSGSVAEMQADFDAKLDRAASSSSVPEAIGAGLGALMLAVALSRRRRAAAILAAKAGKLNDALDA